jgi:FHA domain-containing protein
VTEHGILPGLWPIQGDGVLARQGDLVLLIHPAGGRFTDRLLELLADAARTRASGLEFTDRVSAEFDADAAAADTRDEHGPAAVAFGPAGTGTAVAVYGAGWAEITTSRGAQRLTAGEPYGRLRGVLPSPLVQVRAGVQAVASDAETDPYLRLADGMVRAVALLYAPAEVPAEAVGQARPAAPDYGLAPQASPAAPAPVEQPAPAPVVEEPPPAPVVDQPAPVMTPVPVPEPDPVVASVPVPEPALTPAWPEPEPEPDQGLQATPEPYADEPEYHATRVEPSVPSSAQPDPYTAVDPYAARQPDPYAVQASDPYAAADPYAVQAPPLPADPYAAQGPPDGAQGQDFISMPLAADQPGEMPQRDPLPLGAEPPEAKDLGLVEVPPAMVDGVYCKNGHFNDPDARNCAVCGIGMGHLMKQRQKGNRPPLGVLLLSDGSVCQLDADYVIGREPTLDGAVAEGRARPLRLANASGVVSRMHARVELDGWHVFITDLNSANGTQVLMPGERNPINLQPGVRTALPPGAQIRLGGEYGLQYDSHRQQ